MQIRRLLLGFLCRRQDGLKCGIGVEAGFQLTFNPIAALIHSNLVGIVFLPLDGAQVCYAGRVLT